MSILGDLFNTLTGSGDGETVEKPYEEEFVNALYNVEHIDEVLSRYEVVADAVEAGNFECPYCGAPSANRHVCEYCGMTISEGNGKIRVSSASEIPNPILEAQDLIFKRREAVYGTQETEEPSGILDQLIDAFTGDDDDSFGSKMTEDEIKAMAASYGVTVAAYLRGLDQGKYLTYSAKTAEEKRKAAYSAAGRAAGIGLTTGALYGNSSRRYATRRTPPPQPPRQNSYYYSGRRQDPPAARTPEPPADRNRMQQQSHQASRARQQSRQVASTPSAARPQKSVKPQSAAKSIPKASLPKKNSRGGPGGSGRR